MKSIDSMIVKPAVRDAIIVSLQSFIEQNETDMTAKLLKVFREACDFAGALHGVVCICEAEYIGLKQSEEVLSKLEDAGVDNWSGYNDAMYSDDLEYKNED